MKTIKKKEKKNNNDKKYLFIYLFVEDLYLYYNPVNHTGAPQGF